MFVFLWIAATLIQVASSNAIFKGQVPGKRSPNIVYKIGDLSTPDSKWFQYVELQNSRSIRVFEIGNCISTRTVTVHELGHFLGLCHTQNRNDWRSNIAVRPNNYGVTSFDENSCVSAPVPNGISKPLREGFEGTFTQGVRPSFTDYRTINWLFNCDGKCTTKPRCLNGGYTHPRDCTKCMCNKYYTGNLCEKPRNLVKLSCEGKRSHVREIHVDMYNQEQRSKRKLSDDFFNRGENLWDIIEAPVGKNIKVKVNTWATSGTPLPAKQCGQYAVEINDGDKNMVGKMSCDSWQLGSNVWHNFTAQSNSLGLHMEYAAENPTRLFAQFTIMGC